MKFFFVFFCFLWGGGGGVHLLKQLIVLRTPSLCYKWTEILKGKPVMNSKVGSQISAVQVHMPHFLSAQSSVQAHKPRSLSVQSLSHW